MSEEPRRGDGTPIADGISVAPPGLGAEGGRDALGIQGLTHPGD